MDPVLARACSPRQAETLPKQTTTPQLQETLMPTSNSSDKLEGLKVARYACLIYWEQHVNQLQ